MKLKLVLIIGLLLNSLCLDAQNLSLSDLHKISSVKNWESVNQYLLSKGWEYFESSKGDSERYNIITWSFNRSYNDKAQGWFYVYTTDNEPNKISYTTFNKSSYSAIQSQLQNNNYKLLDSEIQDNEIISEYSNQSYILKISTDKREGSSTFDETITGYQFVLIKKYGTFDLDNGEKVEYHDNGNISMRYKLKNGEIDGRIEVYHTNGGLKKTGSYLKGKPNGLFKEYDENGVLNLEYSMKNDLKNGDYIHYSDDKISYKSNYENGELTGEHVNYFYTDEGKLFLEEFGEFKNGEKTGVWKTISPTDREKFIFKMTYQNGLKNGYFHRPEGDSLIVGNYKNNKLNGRYKVYLDLKRMFVGGMISTDTTKLQILTEGYYFNGDKSGKWSHYDATKTLREEGQYINNLKQGSWKYYYTKFAIDDNPAPYSGNLYLIENYSKGILDGLQKRFSYLTKEEKPCPEKSEQTEGCWEFVFQKVNETSNYKDGELHGEFIYETENLDFIVKGKYEYGEKEGEWIKKTQYVVDSEPIYLTEVGEYTNGKKNRTWNEYVGNNLWREINYGLGVLDGDYIIYSENEPSEKRIFDTGKIKQFIVYDSTGVNSIDKLEYIHSSNTGSLWKRTNPIGSLMMVQEYRVKPDEAINSFAFEFILKNESNSETDKYNTYRDGKFELLENNIPQITGYYNKEVKTGKWTYFYYDQGVKIKSDYINGEKQNEIYLTIQNEPFDGTFVYVDSGENIKEERRVRDGLRDGNTKFIDLTTEETIKREKYKDGEIK